MASPATHSALWGLEAFGGPVAVHAARLIPPTAGTTQTDDGMEIDLVMGAARPWTPGPAMSNTGLGGYNGTIIPGPGH